VSKFWATWNLLTPYQLETLIMDNKKLEINEKNQNPGNIVALIERVSKLENQLADLAESPAQDIEDLLAMVVFSGDLDKAIAAFIIATGAAALGLEVSMFFTFWGINIIKKGRRYGKKNFLEKGFTAMMPGNSGNLPLSELIGTAQELGVRFVSCSMSQELLGISNGELMDDIDYGDVATFLRDASRAKSTLFI
jgi:peroxiredoxin family protein